MDEKDEITELPPELLQRAENARSPVAFLSDEEFEGNRGKLIALLLDGPDKGILIASAPLDYENPRTPRDAIRAQINASPYNGRRYQVRQILEKTPEEESSPSALPE